MRIKKISAVLATTRPTTRAIAVEQARDYALSLQRRSR